MKQKCEDDLSLGLNNDNKDSAVILDFIQPLRACFHNAERERQEGHVRDGGVERGNSAAPYTAHLLPQQRCYPSVC